LTLIEEKIIENQLRWFRHLLRRPLDAHVRRVDCLVFSPMKRGRGRLRKTLEEFVKRGLVVNNISKDLVYNRAKWRCDVADLTYWDKAFEKKKILKRSDF